MKRYNDLEMAMRELKIGARFRYAGEVYEKETEMAVVNVTSGKALIRGLDFDKIIF